MAVIPELLRRASAQHGLVSQVDLDACGVTRGRRAGLVASGQFVRAGRRVWRSAAAPVTDRQRVTAACLEGNGVATRASAAWVHGLPGFGPPKQEPEVVHLEASCQYRNALARSSSSTLFSFAEGDDMTTTVGGVPVLTVAWTLFSLAAEIPGHRSKRATEGRRRWLRRRFRNALDDAVRLGRTTDQELWALLERVRGCGRRGVTEFERALDERANAPTESWLERRFLEVVDRAGLPRPLCQQRIESDGEFVARVDFRYPGSDTIIEVVGHASHCSREQLDRDAHRRSNLAEQGLLVLEFTYDTIVRAPHDVRRRLRRLLQRMADEPDRFSA